MLMPTYAHAPITEALIDIRAELPARTTTVDLERIGAELNGYGPSKKNVEVDVTIQPDKMVQSERLLGHSFVSLSGRNIAQFRLNGFTFNRLKPYENWQSFSSEAKMLWKIYKAKACPLAITRIAVRYINRIELPKPIEDFSKYLQSIPVVNNKSFGQVSSFLLQLKIPQDDLKSILIFNEALLQPPDPKFLHVLVDLDLFREIEVPQSDEEIWSLMDQFRLRKNELFEGCITDHTRELFK